jgi:hypothetical protein
MNNEMMMWKAKRLMKMQQVYALESIAVSLMAMVLIFGLGFIFPSINPYMVVKWIVYVTAVYFVWAVVGNWVRRIMLARMWKKMKSGDMMMEKPEVKSVKKVSKRK